MAGEFRQENQIAYAIKPALMGLPDDVLQRWLVEFEGDVKTAWRRLITGEAHVCDKCHCERPVHQAIALYFQLAGKIGPTSTLIFNLIGQMGARDEGELRSLVDQGRQMRQLAEEGVDDATAIEDSVEILAALLRRHPQERQRVMAKLGSYAEEVPLTNGDTP